MKQIVGAILVGLIVVNGGLSEIGLDQHVQAVVSLGLWAVIAALSYLFPNTPATE